MTAILLVRHGETDWNRERRWQGQSDTPLNDTGRAQARALTELLAEEPIDAIYSSDLVRAHETARLVGERRGLEVVAIQDLRERSFGSVEGMTTDEIQARYPGLELPWSDGETREAMADRVFGALRRIADTHPDANVLVVSHGGPLRAVLTHCGIDGIDRIENCHIIRIAIVNGELHGAE